MMKINFQKTLKAIFVLLFFSFIIYHFTSTISTGNKIDKSGCSTVGITIKYENAGRTSTDIVYYYTVDNKKYKDSAPLAKDVKVPGGKYLVKYLCDKPGVSKIYFDKPVK